jgi:peptidase C39-like protein
MFKKDKRLFLFIILIILGFVFYNNRVVIKEYLAPYLFSLKIDGGFSEPEKVVLPDEIKFEDIVVEEQDIVEIVDEPVEIIHESSLQIHEINLAVPFTIQSPDQKWDEPYKEGCEEASILMVQAFLNDASITVDSALEDIGAMVDWQMENYEGHFDLPVSMTVQMANDFLELRADTIYLSSVEDIKEIIRTGYPLILPTAGRELGNPNFTGEGPLYHMLVVKGFLSDGSIITNDPGTRKGENYIYDPDVLWNAIADWSKELKNPDQDIKVGILLR